jgi:hypothetical protein
MKDSVPFVQYLIWAMEGRRVMHNRTAPVGFSPLL